ncbi:MAG: hypothetical protein COW12_01070, partial [Candidatus Omnitrophica bacterium CG12_big_fil_rev_8_21_14_0_65_45_16]
RVYLGARRTQLFILTEPFDVMLSEAPPSASLVSGGKHLGVKSVKDLKMQILLPPMAGSE